VLSKRIIVCLDVRDGRTTKGVRFRDNVDVGDPVEMARHYYEQGADEIVFYDITASAERRGILIDVVRRVAATIFIPFAVGGGIRSIEEMRAVLLAGAEKVSVNSAALRRPALIDEGAAAFGRQCIVLGMDVLRVGVRPGIASGYEVVIDGGRRPTGRDALAWAEEAEARGAGEICLNSIDADGTQEGYELEITSRMASRVGIPVIASGGAGRPEHLRDVLTRGQADAALIASMVHFGTWTIPGIKSALHQWGVPVRLRW